MRRLELLMTIIFNKARRMAVNPGRTCSSTVPTFKLRRPRGELYKKSPFYLGAKAWNLLPRRFKVCGDKLTFKNMLKRRLGTYVKGQRMAVLRSGTLRKRAKPF